MSPQGEKVKTEAADTITAPSGVMLPVSDSQKERNPGVEFKAADSLLVRCLPCYLSIPPLMFTTVILTTICSGDVGW